MIDENTIKKICYQFIVTGNSIRYISKQFKVPRSTVHRCITTYAERVLPYEVYRQIKVRIRSNKAEFQLTGRVKNIDYRGDISDNSDTWQNENGLAIVKDYYEI